MLCSLGRQYSYGVADAEVNPVRTPNKMPFRGACDKESCALDIPRVAAVEMLRRVWATSPGLVPPDLDSGLVN